MRISDWSSDVCSSDLLVRQGAAHRDDTVRRLGRPADQPPRHGKLGNEVDVAAARSDGDRQPEAPPQHHGSNAVGIEIVGIDEADALATLQKPAERRSGAGIKQVRRETHAAFGDREVARVVRSEEHTSELQSLMRISYAVFCLKKKIREYIKI